MFNFILFGYIVFIGWEFPEDKWFGFDHYDFYSGIGLGFCTICIFKDD